MNNNLTQYFSDCRKNINSYLDSVIPSENEEPSVLFEAMRYSLFSGGKRFRPVLAMTIFNLLGKKVEQIYPFCAAIEMIHTYSLIHDDLPCMDDDDLRRGVETNHIKFGEDIAVLAGDALLTHSFSIFLRNSTNFNSEILLSVCSMLSEKAGIFGMVSGQVFDLISENKLVDIKGLEKIHRNKTGRLIEASVVLPAMLALNKESSPEIMVLQRYASILGIIFQITDDLLDIEGKTESLGKNPGSDEKLNKATYPKIIGVNKTKEILKSYAIDAKKCCDALPENKYTNYLSQIVDFLIHREN